jgi:hypothetical protein
MGGFMTEPNAHRADRVFFSFVGLVAGLSASILIFLIVHTFTLPSEDRMRTGGAMLGAFLSGMVAVGLHWATVWRKSRDDRKELDQMKRAIWQDINATLRVILEEYEQWKYLNLVEKEEISDLETEHLRPTVFDAVLSQIGELEEEQAFYLLLVHDNLRTVREAIKAFKYQPAALAAAPGKTVEEVLATYRAIKADKAQHIAFLLETICCDANFALKALDPDGAYRRRHDAMPARAITDEDPAWRDRLDTLVDQLANSSPA